MIAPGHALKVEKTALVRVALYASVMGALLVFAVWTLQIVLSVQGLRSDVERMVGALSALSRVQARLEHADSDALSRSSDDVQEVGDALAPERAADAELDAAFRMVETAVQAEQTGASAGSRPAIEKLAGLIRKRTAALSRRLGDYWDSINAIVALALLMAALTSLLVIHTWTTRIRRLERERELAYERLRHANRLAAVGTLAAAAAHEIANPLSFTLLNLQELSDSLSASPDLQELASEALTGVQRVSAITRDLKNFAHPNEGATSGVEARAAVEGALKLFEPVRRENVSVVRRLQPTPTVRASQRRLEQVVLNLLLNANHAIAEDGGGLIRVETADDGTSVIVRVIDDGCGVTPELRGRLFEPFATSKPLGQGTGLGLFVCRSIVEAAGGTLELLPNAGGGTIAELKLPREAANPRAKVDDEVSAP